MKSRTLFSKLFPTFFLISLAGIIVLLLITRYALQNFYYQESQKGLVQKAKLIESKIIDTLLHNNDLEITTNKMATLSNSRITILNSKGDVLADSSFDPQSMNNHLDRTEIIMSMQEDFGHSIRLSNTGQNKFLYVAIQLKKDGEILGYLRNAIPLNIVDESLYSLTQKVLMWSFLLFLLMTAVIYVQSKKISTPLENLNDRINQFALENFSNKEQFDLIDSTKEVSALFSTLNKMSEKLNNQFEKIKKQKNEQLAVFASMLEGVITIYPDLSINHINKAALKLFNYQIQDNTKIKGTHLSSVIQSQKICELVEKLIKTQKPIDQEVESKDGLILNMHGTILESSSTGIRGAVLVFDDITKIRELENHRKQFVANVSHELKTPLTAIQGYLETLREEDISNKQTLNRFLDIISKHAQRLKTIIEDLLMLSSLDKENDIGTIKLDLTNISVPIKNVITLVQDKAKQKNISLAYESSNINVKINVPLFEQALINLVDNAIKYGPENSKVSIILKKFDSFVQIQVIDEGQGISKEHHDRLFERFYSVDKARSRELGGSGLGLSIVKHIAISHGGNVKVQSEIGKGSVFIIELPYSDQLPQ